MAVAMRYTPESFGQEVTSTIGMQNKATEFFQPTTAQTIKAFTQEVYQGKDTDYQDKLADTVEEASKSGKKLNSDEWKASPYFREGLTYSADLTEDAAKILADNQDDINKRAFIINHSSGLQKTIGLGTGMALGLAEKKNLEYSIGTAIFGGVILNKVVGVKKLYQLQKEYGKIKYAAGMGALQGAVTTAAMTPSGMESAKTLGQDYTLTDAAINMGFNTILGGAFEVAPMVVKGLKTNAIKVRANTYAEKIQTAAISNGIDPNTAIAIAGAESSFRQNVPNKDTQAFGLFQFTDVTAKRYGITKNSSIDDYLAASMRLTRDNTEFLKQKFNREPTPLEVYAAHRLGEEGGYTVLTADKNRKVIDVLKESPYFKGYEAKVLTQNGLSKDVTVGNLLDSMQGKLEQGLSYAMDSSNLPEIARNKSPERILEEVDTATSQMVEGKRVDLDGVAAKYTDPREMTFKEQTDLWDITTKDIAEVKKKEVMDTVLKNDFNEPTMLYRVESGPKEDFAVTNSDKNIYGDGVYLTSDINMANQYGKKYSDNAHLYKAYADVKNPYIINANEFRKRFSGKTNAEKTSILKAEGFDSVVIKRGASKNNEVVVFDPQNIKRIGNSLQEHNQIKSTEAKQKYVDSLQATTDHTNNTAFDNEGINNLESYSKNIESYKPTDELIDLENEIASLKEQGLLEPEALKILDDIADLKYEDMQSGFQAAYACLNRG